MFVLRVKPIIAKWRPSGDGTALVARLRLAFGAHKTRAFPRRSMCSNVEVRWRLQAKNPLLSAAQSRVSRLLQPLAFNSRAA